MRSANPSNFSRENISCLPRRVLYQVLIFYVNQTDSVLNFARGQTPADDTCVYWNVYWNTVFCGKFRATFLSLSKEKKATSAGLKRLRRSRRPLAYSLKLYQCMHHTKTMCHEQGRQLLHFWFLNYFPLTRFHIVNRVRAITPKLCPRLFEE